ncbi:MAG: c-type cytochrome [Acidimicrobiales bacterium]|nr:c-type cytochrome [Acidimicrobiales bacterium]
MVFANAARNIGIVVAVLALLGWLVYVFANLRRAKPEVGSEIELAPNRKPFYDDDKLETKRLDRALGWGVALLVVVGVGLPLYWLAEPGRQSGAITNFDATIAGWGEELFATTAAGGFNCAGCHGAEGIGGVANYTFTDPLTGEVRTVPWSAPALQTVLYKFSEDELRYILVYGRPFSPMSAWGLAGGGPMNDQQIDSLIEYIKSFQITPEEAQAEVQAALDTAMASGQYDSEGEALFNLTAGQGAYNCARCHTRGWSFGEPQVSGGGAFGPNLTGGSTVRQFPDVSSQVQFIQNGSENGKVYGVNGQGSGRMPGFGQILTEEQVQAIVDYERGL